MTEWRALVKMVKKHVRRNVRGRTRPIAIRQILYEKLLIDFQSLWHPLRSGLYFHDIMPGNKDTSPTIHEAMLMKITPRPLNLSLYFIGYLIITNL